MFRQSTIRKNGFPERLKKESGNDSNNVDVFRRHRPDYWLLMLPLTLLIIGLVVVYSISPGLAAAQNISEHYYILKQFIAIGLGLLTFIFFSLLPIKVIKRSKNSLIWLSLIIIAAVELFGGERWIQIGGFSFQAAELVKFAIIVWAASFLVKRLSSNEVESTDKTLKPIIILIAIIGLLVVGLEGDFGSAVVMIAIIATMAFSAGLQVKKIAYIGGIIAIGAILFISTTPYRRDRLLTFIQPTSDCQDKGYQSCQALIAVGSGGLFGLGLGNGVQAYGYLPEAENDSIFAIIGEKGGFIGGSIVIGLYAILFARMRRIIQRTQDLFSRLFVIGVLAWISIQTIINVGAMVGLLPLKGITLPLVSYGGTSLVFIMAAMGVVFQISRYSSYGEIRNLTINQSKESRREGTLGRRRERRPYYAAPSSR